MSRRNLLAGAVSALALMAVVAVVATSAFGDDSAIRALRSVASPLPLPPETTQLATNAQAEISAAQAREERAREAAAARKAQQDAEREAAQEVQTIEAPAPTASLDPADADQEIVRAEVLKNGIALPPLESPPEVKSIIEAGNGIARTPYLWGGGHGKWQDKGYDCSGSVSFALASAGLLDRSLTSGQLMRWGKPGRGKWVTIWTNEGHVFLQVAGVRFDTSGTRTTGSRWQADMRPTSGFVARHPPGL